MRTGIVSFLELDAAGKRLNGGYFLSEDEEAMRLLRRWTDRTDKIEDLTKPGGVFSGGIFRIVSASDPSRGRPYVSAKDLVQSQITPSTHLSLSMVSLLSTLEIHEGMILVTCSGMNLGKAIWTRRDMAGLCALGDLIRIVPDRQEIAPGYLYAYLSSRFGWASIRKLIYGGHIKHIEPRAVSRIQVPRLPSRTEQAVHELVEKAANLRARAAEAMSSTVLDLPEIVGLRPLEVGDVARFSISQVKYSHLEMRLDAPYHCAAALEVETQLDACVHPVEFLPDVLSSYFKPPLFKRLWVDGPEHGRQFVSRSDAYRYDAESKRYISNKTPNFEQFILERGWVVFQAAGQISGLFGQPLLVCGWLEDLFCADDMYRLVPRSEVDGAYLFAFLRTPHGQVLLKRQACGKSIPRVWDPHMRKVRVPWPRERVREQIAEVILTAHREIEEARQAEQQAVRVVEKAIKGAL